MYCSKFLLASLLNWRGSNLSAILPWLMYQTARMIHPHLKRNQGENLKRAAHCNLMLLRMCMCIPVHRFSNSLNGLSLSTPSRPLKGKSRTQAPARFVLAFFLFFVLLLMLRLVSFYRKGSFLRTFLIPLLLRLWRREALLPLRKLMTMLPMTKLLPPHPLQALPLCISRICELHGFIIGFLVDFCSSMPKQPNINRSQFSIVPFDNERGPSNCPQHLLFTNDEGVVGPVEVIPGCFDIFRDTSWLWVLIPFYRLFSCLFP